MAHHHAIAVDNIRPWHAWLVFRQHIIFNTHALVDGEAVCQLQRYGEEGN